MSFSRIVIVLSGLLYLLTGLALLFAPQWFFATIGNFPPFNRHYSGDLGAFLLPLGIGLLLAASAPSRHRGLLAVAALASLLHAINHVYDDLTAAQLPLARSLFQTLPLLVLAILLIVVFLRTIPERE